MLLYIYLVSVIVVASHMDVETNLFMEFIKKYHKAYRPKTLEFYKRFSIFKQSLKRIEWLNKHRNHPGSALYGITQFSDLTPREFRQLVTSRSNNSSNNVPLLRQRRAIEEYEFIINMTDLPKRKDWREDNAVTKVKNQGKCGSCWAFSTVETIETMYALKTSHLMEWSIQQMIDCATGDNHGCDGGDTCSAIEWLYKYKVKLVPASMYPFRENAGPCQHKKTNETVQIAKNFTCDRFADFEQNMLEKLAYHGPLVAAVDASSWQDYLGGIIQFHCTSELNHAVQIVGYDMRGDIPYYIVRNSWGPNYGLNGYLHIEVGKNLCGIAEEISSLDVL